VGEHGQQGVSIIVPVLQEADYIETAVRHLLEQDYTGPMEIVLALGPSTDGTNEIAHRIAVTDARVICVDNPSGRTPSALNAAIAASHHDVIVRVDAHAEIPSDYVRIAVETLVRTGADNVGGVMGATGVTPFERAVAAAMTSVFGVGSASFHVGGDEGPAASVYLGAFRRSTLEAIGGYDESFVRAQDWEMNHRIRARGGLIWFTPRMHVTYRPRSTMRSLGRQYQHYGRWRREVMRHHPETARTLGALRYFAPPAVTLAVLLGLVVGIGGWALGYPNAAIAFPLLYALGVVAVSPFVAPQADPAVLLRVPLVLATMHLSWGWGFLTSPDDLRDGELEGSR
jgi:glycosyltransferase involved in cell wall biosynthesis